MLVSTAAQSPRSKILGQYSTRGSTAYSAGINNCSNSAGRGQVVEVYEVDERNELTTLYCIVSEHAECGNEAGSVLEMLLIV
jgi:hypothetical protein